MADLAEQIVDFTFKTTTCTLGRDFGLQLNTGYVLYTCVLSWRVFRPAFSVYGNLLLIILVCALFRKFIFLSHFYFCCRQLLFIMTDGDDGNKHTGITTQQTHRTASTGQHSPAQVQKTICG